MLNEKLKLKQRGLRGLVSSPVRYFHGDFLMVCVSLVDFRR